MGNKRKRGIFRKCKKKQVNQWSNGYDEQKVIVDEEQEELNSLNSGLFEAYEAVYQYEQDLKKLNKKLVEVKEGNNE